MKKLIIFTITILLLAALTVPSLAAEEAVFTVKASKTDISRGDTVEYTVTLTGNAKYSGLGFSLEYDKSVFEFVSATVKLTGATLVDFDNKEQVFAAAFTDEGGKNYTGDILTFQLKVRDDAKIAAFKVGGVGRANNGDVKISTKVTAAKANVTCDHDFGEWTVSEDGNHQRICKKCGTKESHKPSFTNGCDKTCNVKGCTITRKTTHKFKTEWSSDGTYHWHECSVCGEKKDKAKHTPGEAPTEQHGQNCTVCGKELKPKLDHTHDFSEEWSYNEEAHWHQCKKSHCWVKGSYGKHTYDDECDTTCNVCGAVRVAPHVMSEEWRGDATGHWHACNLCGEKRDFEPHEPGPEATYDTPQVCTVCGYIIKPALKDHVHNFEGEWQTSDTEHWHECECGEEADREPHTWDDGVVTKEPAPGVEGEKTFTCTICGKQRTEAIPALPADAETTAPTGGNGPGGEDEGSSSGGNWWIVAVAAVGLGGAGIGLVTLFVIQFRKNRHGRFSS